MATISIVPETPVTALLQKAVANTSYLTFLTLNAHWNVIGSDFFQLHKAFNDQYDALFDTIDLLAERIRALDNFVMVNLGKFDSIAGMPSLTAPFTAQDAVSTLIAAHGKNIDDLKYLIAVAGNVNDLTTQNMIMNIVESEQKIVWMLKSYLK